MIPQAGDAELPDEKPCFEKGRKNAPQIGIAQLNDVRHRAEIGPQNEHHHHGGMCPHQGGEMGLRDRHDGQGQGVVHFPEGLAVYEAALKMLEKRGQVIVVSREDRDQ